MRALKVLLGVVVLLAVMVEGVWLSLPPKDKAWDLTPFAHRLHAWGLPMEVEKLSFYYDGSPVIRADGVQVLGAKDELAIYVKRAAVKLANGRLFRLQLAPKNVEVDGATLRLVKQGGTVHVEGFDAGGGGLTWPWFFTLQRIKTVKGAGLNILVRDADKGAEWILENGRIDVTRFQKDGTNGTILATLRHLYGGRDMGNLDVTVALREPPASDQMEVVMDLPGVDASLAADMLPPAFVDLLKAKGDIAVGAAVNVTTGDMSQPWVDMKLQDVRIQPPKIYSKPMIFPQLNMRARYTPSPTDVLELSEVDGVYTGGVVVHARGSIRGLAGGDPMVSVALASPAGDVQRIFDFLPDKEPKMEHTVEWLRTRILPETRYEKLRATWVGAPLHMEGCGLHHTCGITIDAEVARGAVKFDPALPAVTGKGGTFAWRGDWLEVQLPDGKLGTQDVKDLDVRVTELLSPEPSHVHVKGLVAGKLEEILPDLIRMDPKAKPLPLALAGQHNTSLSLVVPLWPGARKTDFGEVSLWAQSTLSGASMRDFAPLDGLVLDKVSGTAVIASGPVGAKDVVPKTLTLALDGEDFGNRVRVDLADALVGFGDALKVDVDGDVDGAWAVRWLGGTGAVAATGPVGAKGAVVHLPKDVWGFDMALDATRAAVKVPQASWEKAKGVALRGNVKGNVRGETATLEALALKGTGVDVRGKVMWTRGGKLGNDRLALSPMRVGGTDVAVNLAQNVLDIQGKVLDLRAFDIFGADKGPSVPRGMALRAHVGLLRAKGGDVRDVKADLREQAGTWQVQTLQGTAPPDGKLDVRREGNVLKVRAQDLGQVLRALGAYDKLRGGTLSGDLTYSAAGVAEGTLLVEKFELDNPPVLVKLLGLLSLQQLLSGTDSVLFDKAWLPLKLDGSMVTLKDANMVGPSMSLRLDGTYDRAANMLDMDGKMAPAIPFNRLVSEIPLLGTLLTGSQDGVVVADFKLKGPTTNPDIHVRPLSVLTPGLLKDVWRGIFGNGKK